MSPLAVTSCVLWPLLLGWSLMRLCRLPRQLDPLAWWGWTWCLGALGTGLAIFAWLCAGAPLAGMVWFVPGLTLALLMAALRTKPAICSPSRPRREHSTLERRLFQLVVVLALALTTHRVLASSAHGVIGDDELYLWARKAKLIFEAGGLNAEFRTLAENPADPLLHPDYPLLNPLLQLWVFAHAGEITHFANRLPVQGFAFALVLIAASALYRRTRPAIAALLLIVVVTLPQIGALTQHVTADLMVGTGLVMFVDALLRLREEDAPARRDAAWRLTCIAAAVMLWSKNEAMLYLAASGTALVLGAPRHLWQRLTSHASQLRWALIPLVLFAIHQLTNRSFAFRNDLLAGDEYGKPFYLLALDRAQESLPVVADYFWRTVLLDPVSNHWLVLLFAAAVLLAPRTAFGPKHRAITLATLLVVGGFFLVYVGTPKGGGPELRALLPPGEGARWHLNNSAPRLFAQITPALALIVALLWPTKPFGTSD